MAENQTFGDLHLSSSECELGTLLRLSMAQQSISMRQLSKSTGISVATISRIINGKQSASILHLQRFAQRLGLPINKLLQSVGVSNMERGLHDENLLLEIIQDVIDDLKIDFNAVTEDVIKELEKLEQYARTKEGKRIIMDSFSLKMNVVDSAGAIINKLNHFYILFCSEDINENEQAVIGSALLYFSLTVGVIPDYCFPIGYLDDAIAVKIVEKKLSLMNK